MKKPAVWGAALALVIVLSAIAANVVQSGWTTTGDPAVARAALGVFAAPVNGAGALTNNGVGVLGYYPNYASLSANNVFGGSNTFSAGTWFNAPVTYNNWVTNLFLTGNALLYLDAAHVEHSIVNAGASSFLEGISPPAFRMLSWTDLPSGGATNAQSMQWNGSAWIPTNIIALIQVVNFTTFNVSNLYATNIITTNLYAITAITSNTYATNIITTNLYATSVYTTNVFATNIYANYSYLTNLNVNVISNFQDITINTNVNITQNFSVSGKATLNNIIVTNTLQYTTNAFPLSPGTTWDWSKYDQTIITNADFNITAISGVTNYLDNMAQLEVSNSAAGTIICHLLFSLNKIGPNTTNDIYIGGGKEAYVSGDMPGFRRTNIVTLVEP